MKQRIELATNLVVIVLGAVLVVFFLHSGLVHWGKQAGPREIAVGSTLPEVPGVGLPGGNPELILAIRAGCPYCEANMPFYAELGALKRDRRLRPDLLAVLPDDREAANAFLHSHRVAMPFVAGIPLPSRRARDAHAYSHRRALACASRMGRRTPAAHPKGGAGDVGC